MTTLENITNIPTQAELKLNFDVIIGFNQDTHQPISMNINDIIKKNPNVKTIQDLDTLLKDNKNNLNLF